MLRLLLVFLPLVCAPILLPAAPVPPGADKPVYYFPTRVGTKYSYDQKGGDEKGRGEIVTASEEQDGRVVVTMKITSADFAKDIALAQYAVSKDGVFVLALNMNVDDPLLKEGEPYLLLKLPHKDGNTWENKKDTLFNRTNVAKTVETVKVSAGTFEAIRVETGKDTVTWFAPDVGVVKRNYGNVTYELKSREIPKK